MDISNPSGEKLDREAADWVVRWDDGAHPVGPGEQSRWLRWLRRSPRHVQSYLDTADLYEQLRQMDPDNRIDVDEWLAGGSSVTAVRPGMRSRTASRRWMRRRSIAAAIAAVAITAGLSLWLTRGEVYRTAVGQQSLYRLADGSVLTLNTRSRARILFSGDRRLIELEGEALLTVTPDPARPFLVRTSGATVQVLGTRFNVYALPGETRVTVVDGAVQVVAREDEAALKLSAGEAARVRDGEVHRQIPANVDAATAWEQQKLVFEDATLAEVAAEFNRYNHTRIEVRGERARQRRLSGTFDALHPKSLLLYLEKGGEVRVRRAGGNFIVSEKQAWPLR